MSTKTIAYEQKTSDIGTIARKAIKQAGLWTAFLKGMPFRCDAASEAQLRRHNAVRSQEQTQQQMELGIP